MIKYYDPEELSEVAKYTVRGTYLFGDDKVVVESKHTMYGNIFGHGVILTTFVDEEPDFVDANHKYIKGGLKFDDDCVEIQVLDNDGKVVACCYGLDELQEHLVGVEIVKVEELEEENGN